MNWNDIDIGGLPDWDWLSTAIPQADAMKTSTQDPVFHAEGDVWTHTRMVVEQLLASHQYASVPEERRRGLLIAAILHDVAKPATRDEVFDPDLARVRVTNHGHSNMGARDSWSILWKAGVPLDIRLQVFALIAAHQKPFHVFKRDDARPEVARFSTTGNWRELLALARADNLGRTSPNTAMTAEVFELLEILCDENGVLDAEWPFETANARVQFLRQPEASRLFYTPQEPLGSRVVVMSAPPGSGKDTYVDRKLGGLPVLSLDALREEMDVGGDGNQGQVVQAALERAREYLRAKQDFVWNATNTSKLMRDKAVGLCLSYDAHVSIHALDCPHDVMRKRNRGRDARVPDDAIDRMLLKWEPPMPGEAHEVRWIDAMTFEPVVAMADPQSSKPSP